MDLSESKWVLLTFPNAISHSFIGTANCDRNIQLRFTAFHLSKVRLTTQELRTDIISVNRLTICS